MSISVIRKFTQLDADRIDVAARAFCQRHGISRTAGYTPESDIEFHCWDKQDKRLARLWRRAYCRALRVPYSSRVTVYAGHVGHKLKG